jgi:hypothetical protein
MYYYTDSKYLQGLYLVSSDTEIISNDYKESFCGGKGQWMW